ncbi:MAG: hypothetical protein EA405_15310 [Rhodospirillales bacterium]|nr:MAG: hypothetical protein EA405_15310 [Rhodospirillales bacterium]
MKFEQVHAQVPQRELSQAETISILRVSERGFPRWWDLFEADGRRGFATAVLGKVSAPPDDVRWASS